MSQHSKRRLTGRCVNDKVRLNNGSASSVKLKREIRFGWVLVVAALLLLAPTLGSAASDSDLDSGQSIAEGAPAEPPEGEVDGFEQDDQDGDGRVSETEFSGPSEHFDNIDQNQDGYIDSDERPQGPPGGGNSSEGAQGPPGGRRGPRN